jgi:NADH dehydrogenase
VRLCADFRNIAALEQRRKLSPFDYRDKGQMAIIGRCSAVVDAFGIHVAGSPAWIGCLGLHLVYLSGLRNRLVVLMDWIAAYVSPTRGAGVITRPVVPAGLGEAEREAA